MLNKVKMYDAVRTVLGEHESAWGETPAFVGSIELFKAKLTDLKMNAMQQEMLVKGVSKMKAEYKSKLVNEAWHLRYAVLLHAEVNNLLSVRESLRFSRTELRASTEMLLFIRATKIKDLAFEYAPEIEQFGITEEMILAFAVTLENYDQAMTSVRNGIVSRKTVTSSIELRIAEIDRLLNTKIDIMVKLLKVEHESFAQEYFNARKVIDAKGKSSSPPADDGIDLAS